MPSDLIYREDAKDFVRHAYHKGLNPIEYLDEVPAAYVRPVVLCRDCVYYNTTGCADGFGWCEGVMVSKGTTDDFFCAEGKQKPYDCGADMRNMVEIDQFKEDAE